MTLCRQLRFVVQPYLCTTKSKDVNISDVLEEVPTFFYNFEDVDNFYHFAVAVY
jgi:hypothetical protein